LPSKTGEEIRKKLHSIIIMNELQIKGIKAKAASFELAAKSSTEKDAVLKLVANALLIHTDKILKANELDIVSAEQNGIKGSLLDRLMLNQKRVTDMADGLIQITQLPDPIGEVIEMKRLANGLDIGKRRVPLGVIGIIYEARPNVTADAFGLCLKAGNCTILRGGKEAIHSNTAIVEIIRKALQSNGFPADAVQIVEDTSRESAIALMQLNEYLDVLIPRGGAGLIQSVVKNSTVPVIETGVGVCHIYIDEFAEDDMAVAIAFNAKTHRPGVCNAAETFLIHSKVASRIMPKLAQKLSEKNVEIRGDATICSLINSAIPATDEDWSTEYLDYIVSVKVVQSVDEAIQHINTYGTKHSEAIVTQNYTNSQKFLNLVDAAAVYINASTRFTDGMQFGMGAEIGISTQKLHARGPMGLRELTSSKYIIYGNGQIRE